MERTYRAARTVAAPPEAVFDFFADFRNVGRVLDGVTRWQPLGRASGVGARFDVEMNLAGLPLGGILVLDRWKPPVEIGWVSESGPGRQRGRWRFRPGQGGTRIELAIGYDPPGAFLGNLVADRFDDLVRRRLERALERAAALLEGPDEG